MNLLGFNWNYLISNYHCCLHAEPKGGVVFQSSPEEETGSHHDPVTQLPATLPGEGIRKFCCIS